jgi:hypothetical protein
VRLTAKQAPHRPGISSALGLRAGGDDFLIVTQTACSPKEIPMSVQTWFSSRKLGRSRRSVQRSRGDNLRRRPASRRLAIEALEDRHLLTAVISIANVSILEGNAGAHTAALTVNVSEPHSNAVSVDYRTADGTATAGSDYSAVSGKLSFAKNEMSKTILVPIIGDRAIESSEAFFVNLQNAKGGAKIANSQAAVTIVDDEPLISINDVSGTEGNSGATPLTFTVSLSAPYDLPVTVNYATSDGSASAGSDYAFASGPLVFAPGETSKTITVDVNGNRLPGSDKNFFVSVSTPNSYAGITKDVGIGAIIEDEPRISIADAYNYGETSFTFTVSLSAAYDQDVMVSFATADGTAIAGADYVATAGTLTFAPGETTKTITVEVLDTTSADKSFSVHLSGVSTNALIANEQANGYWYYDTGYYDYGYYDYYGYYDDYYGY